MSVQRDIDRLCEWYSLNKPAVTRIVVNAKPETVYKFAGKPEGGDPIRYRGFEIVLNRLSARVKRMDETGSAVNQLPEHK